MTAQPTPDTALTFDAETPPTHVGMSVEGVQRIARVFEEHLARGLHPAAQLVVLRHGRVVLDRAAGWVEQRRGQRVTPATPFLTFSISKPFTAVCIHKLVEEGRVELDAPIARYWPEFGQRGKEGATVRHALLHQAGIPMRGLNRQVHLWPNWLRITRSLAALPAEWEPGSRTAYHLVNFGFILGEVVRRVTGVPIERFLHEQFLEPLGLRHTALGLPDAWRGQSPRLFVGHREQRSATWLFNLPAIRRAIMPGATLHSTARDIAVFYQMLLNGGHYAGQTLLQPETIGRATALGHEGYDGTILLNLRWAMGFQLGGSDPAKGIAPEGPAQGAGSTVRTFGHFGNATSMSWADPDAGLVVAFTCNRLLDRVGNWRRWKELSDAVWAAVDGVTA